jgi:hypothetical protein
MNDAITVIKCHPDGEEMFRWQGKVIERSPNEILLEAHFNIPQHYVGGMQLNTGDRLVESYYSDRWYNIFEVYDREKDTLKGWYCNLSEPAEIGKDEIVFRDLALDLIVYPDGRQEEIDLDEFEELEISEDLRAKALVGWDELRQHFIEQFRK